MALRAQDHTLDDRVREDLIARTGHAVRTRAHDGRAGIRPARLPHIAAGEQIVEVEDLLAGQIAETGVVRREPDHIDDHGVRLDLLAVRGDRPLVSPTVKERALQRPMPKDPACEQVPAFRKNRDVLGDPYLFEEFRLLGEHLGALPALKEGVDIDIIPVFFMQSLTVVVQRYLPSAVGRPKQACCDK